MRHEAILGVQQALDLPGVVGMKTDLNGGILDAGVRRGGYLMWPNKGDFKFQWSAAPRCNQGWNNQAGLVIACSSVFPEQLS